MKLNEFIFFFVCLKSKYVHDAMYLCNQHGIAYKQMLYYLKKWVRKGFYNYGVSIANGWFDVPLMPDQYFEIARYVMLQDIDKPRGVW